MSTIWSEVWGSSCRRIAAVALFEVDIEEEVGGAEAKLEEFIIARVDILELGWTTFRTEFEGGGVGAS